MTCTMLVQIEIVIVIAEGILVQTHFVIKALTRLCHSVLSGTSGKVKNLKSIYNFPMSFTTSPLPTNPLLNISNLFELTIYQPIGCLNLILRWSIKGQLSPKQADMFPLNKSIANTRYRKKFKEYYCPTAKFCESAIPSMTRSLNEYFASQISSTSLWSFCNKSM